MQRLEHKVAIVTGGGGAGIGHGISLALAREGASVAIFEIDLEAGDAVRQRIEAGHGCAKIYRADISRSEDVREAVAMAVRDFGRLDILVNNAGIGLVRPAAEVSEEEYDRLHAIDLRGAWLCAKFAIPHMQRAGGGSIINIASVHACATVPMFALYAAMKSGLTGLTRGLAVQYGPENIRVNAVLPGLVDAPQTRAALGASSPDIDAYLHRFITRFQAMPVAVLPEDVGRVVAFLASDDARGITGAEIPVDAGLLAILNSKE